MLWFAHRLLVVLIVFAFIGGPTAQLGQSAAFMATDVMADLPCDMAMPMADAGHGAPVAPCKGLTPECVKQMGCVANIALPARLADNIIALVFGPVTYWSAWTLMAGVAREPEPLPPRTA